MRSPDEKQRNSGSENRDLGHPAEIRTTQKKKDYAVISIATS
jgi:hypothetical protein